jgi:hypothetical protein
VSTRRCLLADPSDWVHSMTRQKTTIAQKIGNAFLVLLVLPIALPLALISLTFWLVHRVTLYGLVWVLWLPKGKDILFVSSDSPIWQDYMATQVLPQIQERAIILNWSERNKWSPLSFRAHVFRSFGGGREFNPLVICFSPFRRARIYCFWPAFRDWKRGYKEPVERLSQELFSGLKDA